MTTKLEQAARQIIVDWDSGIHLYEAIAALRKALAEQAERRPQNCGTGYCSCIECPYEAKQAEQEPVALLQLAEDALVYHTEQTRPIQNTIDVLAAIQKFKEKQR